ncbi:hypothetical protein H6F55_08620 [Phormidium sp. FACHB-322]|uniref:hypothetical protein n=1 Tax=Cyanophyceae TaxID=3028117 RepID=UPI0016895E97|nr:MULTISPECIES: hypothetical protein [Cyanophyceae]MBD1915773.1 hypothetical protein [Phormidium sp. FACHB-77]MBD2030040.1 hypothetical protein [Phormidium sp. FACHB-322]MBD2052152.1 hypothetical protein [Leptolyngbya sp. FACHB-60]
MPLGQRSKPKRRLLIAAIVGGLLVTSFPLVVVGGLLAKTNWDEWQECRGYTEFNPTLWNDPALSAEPTYVRLCMVDDLLAKYLLLGRPQAGVIELLGPPEPQKGFADYDMVYRLGPERQFISIDYEWLVIKLDAAGHVSDASLVTD